MTKNPSQEPSERSRTPLLLKIRSSKVFNPSLTIILAIAVLLYFRDSLDSHQAAPPSIPAPAIEELPPPQPPPSPMIAIAPELPLGVEPKPSPPPQPKARPPAGQVKATKAVKLPPPRVAEPLPEKVTAVAVQQTPQRRPLIKLAANGQRLPETAQMWSCIEDPNRGLIWEVKSADGALHDRNNLYSWYMPDSGGVFVGVNDGGRCSGGIKCDSHAFTAAANREHYCGYSDWRLPTLDEMVSLIQLNEKGDTAAIDTDHFPEALPSWYWTATSHETHPQYAWYLLFRNGIALSDLKGRPKHIRLVRSQRPAASGE